MSRRERGAEGGGVGVFSLVCEPRAKMECALRDKVSAMCQNILGAWQIETGHWLSRMNYAATGVPRVVLSG